MVRLFYITILCANFIIGNSAAFAQSEETPVRISMNRVVINRENQYTLYIPTFEFHMFFQREFNVLRSAVNADYDYRRQDMGFGMSHQFYKYIINPGVHVQDNLYFREVFSDSTGIWRRKQSINPYLVHELTDKQTIVMEFKFEREWSPVRRMGSKIVSEHDRSVRLYYIYTDKNGNVWNNNIFYLSFERSYKFFRGQFNYFLMEAMVKKSTVFNDKTRLNSELTFRGNITPQSSPIFFLGGQATLIGYETDEIWGRKILYSRNLLEYQPFPDYEKSIFKTDFRRFSFLFRADIGKAIGAPDISDLKMQDDKWKLGIACGFGFNTDLPYMPSTNIHFLFASPSDDLTDLKYYFGFGNWLD